MKRRVYRALNPPISGGTQFFDVNNKIDAINLTKKLNKNAKKKDWVWA